MESRDTQFYDIYRTYLKTQELMLDYTEKIFGTFVSIGNGRFMIFSTLGMTEPRTPLTLTLLNQITDLTKLSVNMGMGFGGTAFEAEKNARLALNYAERRGQNTCIFVVDESGTVNGPLNKPEHLQFKFRTEDKDLTRKLHHARVSIATYEKILLVQRSAANRAVTSATVSDLLGMTERNARKILAALQQNDLAEIIGQETPTTKGRPRQVFRVYE